MLASRRPADHRVERPDVVGEVLEVDRQADLLEDAGLLGDREREPARPRAVPDRDLSVLPRGARRRWRRPTPATRGEAERRPHASTSQVRRAYTREPPGWLIASTYGRAVSVEGPSKDATRCVASVGLLAGRCRSERRRSESSTALASSASAWAPDAVESRGVGEEPAHARGRRGRRRPRAARPARRGCRSPRALPARPRPAASSGCASSFDNTVSAVRRASTGRGSSPRVDAVLRSRRSPRRPAAPARPSSGANGLGVAGGEAVDLVEVVGQCAQGRPRRRG